MPWRCSRVSAAVALAVVAVCLPPPSEATEWTSFRGPHGTGEAQGLPPGEGPLVLQATWKRPLGSAYSGISIAGDTLITAVAQGERDWVVALDAATGEERWRYDLAPFHRGHDGSHDGPISTPAIAGGRVFALDPAGQVASIDLRSGEGLWTTHLVDALGTEKPFYDFGSSPVVVGETMVLQIGGEAGSVAGFDVATGELRWRVIADRVVTQSPIVAEIASRQQLLVLGAENVAGIDPASGTILWQMQHGGGRGISAYASPVPLGEDRILIQNSSDATTLLGLSAEDSGLVPAVLGTSQGLTKSYSPPARSGQYVYGYTGRFLSAVDPVSGELLWRSREPGDGFLIAIGDRLAVLTKTGGLHLGEASPAGWQEQHRLDLFEDLAWTPPSYSGGAIYVRSLGEIARVDLVRTDSPALLAATTEHELPAALRGLAAGLGAPGDPSEAVDRFLEGRSLPLIQGREVVFLWRGEARDVAIAGDMIGMRREEPMQRVEGTDLWWWATELDPRARMSYLFYVDYVPTSDPTHDRTVQSTILGPDRNWSRGEGVEMSWFAMPEWPGWRTMPTAPGAADERRGRTETFELSLQPPSPEKGAETPAPVQVPVHVWLPPGYDQSSERYPVVYLQEVEALEVGQWPQALDAAIGRSASPLIAVFFQPPRMPGADTMLGEQVVPGVDQRYRTLADREHRAIVGMGWGGLDAVATAFADSELFGVLGVQSFFGLETPMDSVRESLGEATASTMPLRIYFEWGRWDLISPHENMNMREWPRVMWNLLLERGWSPVGGEVWDSTDWASWRNRTGVMLASLFPLDGAESGLAVWQTGEP